MVASLKSTEGVVSLLKDDSNKAILQRLGELEGSEDEDEDEVSIRGRVRERVFLCLCMCLFSLMGHRLEVRLG